MTSGTVATTASTSRDHGVGPLQGRPLVEVEDQEQLVLVVVRQHLQRDDPQRPPGPPRRPSAGAMTSRNDTAAQPGADQRGHHRAEQSVQEVRTDRLDVVGIASVAVARLAAGWRYFLWSTW